ncbi:hypothetical protein CK203_080248 [Vitis vinifera]|uniref:Uncharacterized protein n=1 Tax=Vitis vinifera TaxID=29760 RepID=A0A438EPC2_VITVI|nr:hypothetical protein CK203_080248 [Vitis vinifera]
MVTDALVVKPLSTMSIVDLLNKSNIHEVGGFEAADKRIAPVQNCLDECLPREYRPGIKNYVGFQALPVGTVISLLTKKSKLGCLDNLYESVENLSESTYLNWTHSLNNHVGFYLFYDRLEAAEGSLVIFPIQPPNFAHWHHREFTSKRKLPRNLHKSINKLEEASLLPQSVDAILRFFDLPLSSSDRHVKDGLVTYMVADDLSVTPMSMTSTMALFKKYNIQEVVFLRKRFGWSYPFQ